MGKIRVWVQLQTTKVLGSSKDYANPSIGWSTFVAGVWTSLEAYRAMFPNYTLERHH